MGWSMTFFGANLANWEGLDPAVRDFLETEFTGLEETPPRAPPYRVVEDIPTFVRARARSGSPRSRPGCLQSWKRNPAMLGTGGATPPRLVCPSFAGRPRGSRGGDACVGIGG